MKKTLIIILLMVLLTLQVYSSTTVSVNLDIKESVVIAGKNITFLSLGSNNKILISIDGDQHIISTSETEDLDGIHITTGLIYDANKWRNLSIDFDIVIDYTCGNGVCETDSGEGSTNCCGDCNCSTAYSCYSNQCIKSDLLGCQSDTECDDKDFCTFDFCTKEIPVTCRHTEITECSSGDDCCPGSCTNDIDDDCPVFENITEKIGNKTIQDDIVEENITMEETITKNKTMEDELCKTDDDCDDNNETTVDKCSNAAKLCVYVPADEIKSPITDAVILDDELNNKEPGFFRKIINWLFGIFQKR